MDTFQIECLKDGSWSNEIPICKSKKTKSVFYKDHELPSTSGIRAEITQRGPLGRCPLKERGQEVSRHMRVGQKKYVSFSNKTIGFQKKLFVGLCFLNMDFTSACRQVAKLATGIACLQVQN